MFQKKVGAGLDIGEQSVKYAAVEPESRRIRVLWSADTAPQRQSYNEETPEPVRTARIREVLADLQRQHPTAPRSVTLAIQGEDTYCRYLELPPVSTRELATAVPSAARRFVPVPMDSLTLSYVEVPPLDPTAENRKAVFYVAAKRDVIQRVTSTVVAAGWEVRRLELAPLALAREFAVNHHVSRDQFVAIAHVGFRQTHMIVMRENYPYYVREFSPAGRNFTYGLQMAKQISWDMAERERRLHDLEENKIAMEPFVLRWMDEVKRTLVHFREQCGNTPTDIKQVILSGGGALWHGMDHRLGEYLGVPVVLDHWDRLTPLNKVGEAHEAPLYKVAVGAALEA